MTLIEALTVIKDECSKHECCVDCPLRDYDNSCYIQYKSADLWNFNVYDVPPRVFK